MNKKKLTILFLGIISLSAKAQSIGMNFPYFRGKSYDFIIFQGDEQKKVYSGVIPTDGKFTLNIPKEYLTYNGMSRWLITGTAEGGGLDMYIPGNDFSVSCTEDQPNERNIIYTNNDNNTRLSKLFHKQMEILARYEAMQQSIKAFTSTDTNYPVFQQEYKKQIEAYNNFQQKLTAKQDYISHFLQIVNITREISNHLTENKQDKAIDILQYITNELDWATLYTSGHWTTIINTWLNIHTQAIKNPEQFSKDFRTISVRVNSAVIYKNLAKTIAHYLSQEGQDEYIRAIIPIIKESGKITQYDGELATYTKGTIGLQASDLIIQRQETNGKKQISKTQTLKIADKAYQHTILLFYQSTDCKTCDQQLQKLTANYQSLTSKGVRIITLSADKNEAEYNNKSKTFPWKDTYYEYKGEKSENFKNYNVTGVPTIILTDTNGKIISRGAAINF